MRILRKDHGKRVQKLLYYKKEIDNSSKGAEDEDDVDMRKKGGNGLTDLK